MSLIVKIFPYAIAYLFLSICVALVVGRVLRTMTPDEDLNESLPCILETADEGRVKEMPALNGVLST